MKSLDKSEGDFEEVASPHTYSSYICKNFHMNLPVTVKDAQMFPQLKWQIRRIETREGKGRTATAQLFIEMVKKITELPSG